MLESWHVVLRCCARLLLVGGAVTYSALAPALGLGDITLHSALNQPLRADIALVDVGGLEEGELSVSLATAEEFTRAGVDRVFFLNDLKFTPILRGNRSLIRVTSNKPVNEPFLNFMVQLNQPNGRLLREYTVLIDPPGSPGIVPADDEPVASPQNSPFPSVKPATAAAPAAKKSAPAPAAVQPAAPVPDPVAEQLAASVLQNQQLQKTVDELNAKLQAQDEQIAGQKKQVTELQTRLAEVNQTPPVTPAAVASAPVVVEEPEASHWPLIIGLLALIALVLFGLFVRRRRQQLQALPDSSPVSPAPHEPVLERPAQPSVQQPIIKLAPDQREETSTGDVLEGVGIYLAYGRFSEAVGLLREALVKEPQREELGVQLLEVLGKQGDVPAYDAQEKNLRDGGFDEDKLQAIRARSPKLGNVPPVASATVIAAVPAAAADEFQLNLDDLSMDSSWDLISPFDNASTAKPSNEPLPATEPAFASNLHVLPDVFEMPEEPTLDEPELEWVAEPDSQALDDNFLEAFSDGPSLELEPLNPQPADPTSADKLEQAQTCIDDGDMDSAIELLNELLKEGDEPLKQTARSLLAGIR
ncbi:peptidoglycan-binding protein LysM [Pseudomonas sp. 31-12]|uniref:FimV/HubP family polar landmark protein n=1 Tax=Pseudomonas sp. 31-12 TaxID=2201356 RepID=UPI000D6C21F2|nr:FimV/HubP family polar landmark protein [Pseudomonas sp. 31-12]AWM95115.1 peptidoglycan-binding protein LysM [Pseudomonas sp. 31-12]